MIALAVVFDVNHSGVAELATGIGMKAEMVRRATNVARTAQGLLPARHSGGQIEVSGFIGLHRARASVIWPGGLAMEYAHRILGRAIDAARG